jgi:hypothetical protein
MVSLVESNGRGVINIHIYIYKWAADYFFSQLEGGDTDPFYYMKEYESAKQGLRW